MTLEAVRRVLVVGAGTMGPGIAQLYALAGMDVDLVDQNRAILASARERIERSMTTLASAHAISGGDAAAASARIHLSTDLASVAPFADLVTEAITEDREAKRRLFEALSHSVRPGVVLASNTSGLDVFSLLADVVPDRLPDLIIHHYFLPPTIIPLVEVVPGPATRPELVDQSVVLLRRLGREPVVLEKFHSHFIVNHIQVAIGAAVARLLAEGVATPADIDRAVKHSLGIRLPVVGVAQTYDFTGLDLVARLLHHSGIDASFFESRVAEGKLGVKSGEGLYDYGGRSVADIEAERDRKYLANLANLRAIDALRPI